MAHVLVIDVGSSSVRAAICDETAHILGETVEPYTFTVGVDGTSEVDARKLRGVVEGCVDRIVTNAPPIEAVAVATFVGNLLGVDAENQPVTPVFTYADTRPAEDVEALRSEVDVARLYQATGCPLHTAYHPARLRWYGRSGRIVPATWLDFGTYLYRAWFGREVPCSPSVASWGGLFDRTSRSWSTEWLHILGVPLERLPPLAGSRYVETGLAPAFAERWPALRGAPFLLAIGDGAAAHVGSGAISPRSTSLTVGTTAALRQMRAAKSPPCPVPKGLWAYGIDETRELLGGATSEGGNAHAWARAHLKLDGEPLVFGEPFAHGLTVLPMFAGERSPGYRPDATATLHGLRLSTTPRDIVQALYESIALRLAQIHDALGGGEALHAGGGALSASPAWAQMFADAMQTPVHLMGDEATVRGTAMLALEALGLGSLESLAPSASRIFEPRPEVAEVYRAAKERQIELYERLYS
ncbi:FGGY family carbohydrate kinase [Polyangium sp. y55x31]|uniref:gluconokinase n=1 Tax=Polyangium sp. y55x31 TaxID=3042688 RepID=UPI00248329EA|nr:FGGY family carbohydrate kinase [Polyangium sp. y55x31]MDI1479176.1 FGGY family carbohydrate kinase [Polyangium sp. y55x31]